MGIPISITGMSSYIKDISDGNLILVQGSIDPITTIFVQTLSTIAVKEEKPVNFITSRTVEEVREQIHLFQSNGIEFPVIEERSHRHWENYIVDNGVMVIDSFSYLNLERPLSEVRRVLEDFLRLCKQKNSIILLTIERGMLSEQVEVTCSHLADGIFNFLTKDTDKGIRRYIRIPKWMDGRSLDDNIYYHFNGREIRVDLRSRVN